MLSDLSGYIIFPDAAGLSKASSDSVRSTVKITDLLDTSDSSFIKVDPSSGSASKEDGDVDGPFSVGYSITETVDKKETNLLVFASSGAFSESFTQTTQLANATVDGINFICCNDLWFFQKFRIISGKFFVKVRCKRSIH